MEKDPLKISGSLRAEELAEGLQTKRVCSRIHAYETTDSTMEVAHRLARSGEPDGTVVIAEAQSKGRGRLGRNWVSPKGTGVYTSIILRPSIQLSEIPLITLMTAVAVAHTIQAEADLRPEIKWPNDLLIGEKKVAGILTELNAGSNRQNYVVVGIGVNVNTPASSLPDWATSLAEELGHPIDRLSFARTLFLQIDSFYEQFLNGETPVILDEWRRFASFLGRRVRIVAEGRNIEGQAVDLDSTGALLVRTDHGFVESVAAGRVVVVQ